MEASIPSTPLQSLLKLRELGGCLEDLAIMAWLSRNAGSDFPGIAAGTAINPTTLRRYVATLRKRDLIRGEKSHEDGRQVAFSLTATGASLMAAISPPPP